MDAVEENRGCVGEASARGHAVPHGQPGPQALRLVGGLVRRGLPGLPVAVHARLARASTDVARRAVQHRHQHAAGGAGRHAQRRLPVRDGLRRRQRRPRLRPAHDRRRRAADDAQPPSPSESGSARASRRSWSGPTKSATRTPSTT